MTQATYTVKPAQCRTTKYSVYYNTSTLPMLLATVEVPHYARKHADANRLSSEKKQQLAIKFALESVSEKLHRNPERQPYGIVNHSDGRMQEVSYDASNPTLDVVWNPNEDTEMGEQ